MHSQLESTDKLIRPVLRKFIESEHAAFTDYQIYEEFAIWGGEARADFAALNGRLRGYEIKSSKDTLSRLERQRTAYNSIFDEVTIVGDPKHISDWRRFPAWWGVIKVTMNAQSVELERLRKNDMNPKPSRTAIASLLWRPEALTILRSFGLDTGLRSKPMYEIVARLSNEVPTDLLSKSVRDAIRSRGEWQAAARRKQCGGTYPPFANSGGCPRTPYGNSRR